MTLSVTAVIGLFLIGLYFGFIFGVWFSAWVEKHNE